MVTFGTEEGTTDDFFLVLFYNAQFKFALTYRAGQDIH